MKKIILGVVLTLIPANAWANCPSGVCEVEINCTTGVVTYRDAPPRVDAPAPIIVEAVAPTHQVVIQTANQSIGFSGSLEAVTAELANINVIPQAPLADSCVLGTCTKVEVNATTGVTTVLPLSLDDLAQRYKDAQFQYQRNLELAQAAQEALIVPIQPTAMNAITVETATVTSASIQTKKIKAKPNRKVRIK
jgi:hypothetical protein